MNSAQRRKFLRKLRRTVLRVAEEMDFGVEEVVEDHWVLTEKTKQLAGLAPEDDWEDHFERSRFMIKIDHKGEAHCENGRDHQEKWKLFNSRFRKLMGMPKRPYYYY